MEQRSRIRWIFEGRFAAGLRSVIAHREARREERFVQSVQASLGLGKLNLARLQGLLGPNREKFFILGNSANVEKLREEDFEEIRFSTSAGINAWVLHSFVPDIYVYEPVTNPRSDHFKTLSFLDRPEVVARNPYILILRPRNKIEAVQLEQIPSSLRPHTFVYGRVNPYTRKVENLSKDLTNVLHFLKKSTGSIVALDSGATIVRIACLATLLGFKEIIFVGVDLNDTDYFWEVNPLHLAARGIESFDSEQRGDVHESEMAEFRPFAASEMVRELAVVAKKQFDVNFLVASQDSKLARFLPVYRFSTEITQKSSREIP